MCEKLGVVCVEVMAHVEAVNRIRHVFCIVCELLRTDPRPFLNTKRQSNWPRVVIWCLECLRATGVVRAKPLQLVLFDAKPITEYVDENFVVDSVKGGAKVQQYKS